MTRITKDTVRPRLKVEGYGRHGNSVFKLDGEVIGTFVVFGKPRKNSRSMLATSTVYASRIYRFKGVPRIEEEAGSRQVLYEKVLGKVAAALREEAKARKEAS